MSSHGALVVIGSGPGIGRTTAAQFASQGFKHIYLLSRDKSRLAEDAKAVSTVSSSAKVDVLQIDLGADESAVRNVLKEVDSKIGAAGVQLEVVLYNAARVGPSLILQSEAQQLTDDLKVRVDELFLQRYC